ncbi:hypothetical protein NZA98_02530, partial [Escherichia coli]|nr:hypothetical protein [Escherichia coli]
KIGNYLPVPQRPAEAIAQRSARVAGSLRTRCNLSPTPAVTVTYFRTSRDFASFSLEYLKLLVIVGSHVARHHRYGQPMNRSTGSTYGLHAKLSG